MDIVPAQEFDSYLYVGECLQDGGMLREVEKHVCFKGGRIHQARNLSEARAIIENKSIRAVLIDQYLSSGNGIDMMLWMQNICSLPYIVVIMNKSVVDVIVALEAGAADAVYAHISARELAARIRASTRKVDSASALPALGSQGERIPGSAGARVPLYFTLNTRRLYFSDTSRIVLHGKEGELLALLIERHPAYINREEISVLIFNRNWHPSDRSIDNLMSRLRKVIDCNEESVIETIRNEGYRLRQPIGLVDAEQGLLPNRPEIRSLSE